jgi:hypothetical protein
MRPKRKHPKKFRTFLTDNAHLLEIIKNIAEIVALFIAAAWALYNFELKDTPSLENSIESKCELHIDSLNSNHNLVYFLVHTKNIGSTSFDVDSVIIRYWLFPIDTVLNNGFFSAEKYMQQRSSNFYLNDNAFSYHFSPGKESAERYNFILPNMPDQVIMTCATFFLHGKKGIFRREDFEDKTYTMQFRCAHK